MVSTRSGTKVLVEKFGKERKKILDRINLECSQLTVLAKGICKAKSGIATFATFWRFCEKIRNSPNVAVLHEELRKLREMVLLISDLENNKFLPLHRRFVQAFELKEAVLQGLPKEPGNTHSKAELESLLNTLRCDPRNLECLKLDVSSIVKEWNEAKMIERLTQYEQYAQEVVMSITQRTWDMANSLI